MADITVDFRVLAEQGHRREIIFTTCLLSFFGVRKSVSFGSCDYEFSLVGFMGTWLSKTRTRVVARARQV